MKLDALKEMEALKLVDKKQKRARTSSIHKMGQPPLLDSSQENLRQETSISEERPATREVRTYRPSSITREIGRQALYDSWFR